MRPPQVGWQHCSRSGWTGLSLAYSGGTELYNGATSVWRLGNTRESPNKINILIIKFYINVLRYFMFPHLKNTEPSNKIINLILKMHIMTKISTSPAKEGRSRIR